MKGIVFSINNFKHKPGRTRFFYHRHSFTIIELISKYKLQLLFFLVFLCGMILGIVYSHNCDKEQIEQFQFLFDTNIDARMTLSAFEIFCSYFASDFIFIFMMFLFGFASWGMAAVPFVCALKGFVVGISFSYLFLSHSISGVGFYVLVILPGTVLFLFAMLNAAAESFLLSIKFFKSVLPATNKLNASGYIKFFLYRYFTITIITLLSAVADTVLWVLFANMFEF